MHNLRKARQLQNSVPALNTESSNVDTETENQHQLPISLHTPEANQQSTVSINQGPRSVNKSSPVSHNPTLTPPSSCSILDKSRFVSSRVPLHTSVPQNKKEKM